MINSFRIGFEQLAKGFFLALLILFFLIGCSSADKSGSEKKRLILSSISPPKSFNPITAKETSTTQITSLMFLGLTSVDGVTGKVQPELAKEWEMRDGGRTWIFTLREGLKWSDGEPLTASDVVFTYEQIYTNSKIQTTARSTLLVDGKAPNVEKLGRHKVKFHYPHPYAPFDRVAGLSILPEQVFRDMSAREINSAWGVGTDTSSIVVNGPFRIKRYATSQRVIMQPNPHYYKTGPDGQPLPKLDRINFEIIKSSQVVIQRFLKGKIDAVSVQPSQFPVVKSSHDPSQFRIVKAGPTLGTLFLTFNMNTDINPNTGETYIPSHKLDWFNDPNFRRAVSYGIDRSNIIDIVYNSLGTPQYGPVSPGNKIFYNPNLKEYPHDLKKARRILSENGYKDRDGDGIREDKDGNPIKFTLLTNSGNDQRVEMSEIIRKDLSNLGFDVNFNQIAFNTLVSKLNSNYDWEAVVIGFTGSLEPHFGSTLWKSSGDLHLWHPKQEEPHREWEAKIDRIFQKAVKETDRQKRIELYHRWQEIVNRKQPVIYTVTGESIYAIRNYVEGMKPTSIGGMLHNVEYLDVNSH